MISPNKPNNSITRKEPKLCFAGNLPTNKRNQENSNENLGGSFLSPGDRPAPGDYDGDGKTDIAVWLQSTTPGASVFWVRGSLVGVNIIRFGQSGDYPVASFNVH